MPDGAASLARVPFTMPALGADMDEGSIVEWLVAEGAHVHRGDVVAVVQTDKNDLDVEVFADGTVTELVVPPGEKVPVGTVLAWLAPNGAVPNTTVASAQVPPVSLAAPAPEPATVYEPTAGESHVTSPVLRHLAEALHVDTAHLQGSGRGGRITRDDIEHAAQPRRRISPRARRLAREHGVDTSTLESGTHAVVGEDVLRSVSMLAATDVRPVMSVPAQAHVAPRRDRQVAAVEMRRAISRVMTKAWQEIPHYQVATRIDLQRCLESLAALNSDRTAATRILPAAVFAHAAARAATSVPEVNGHWLDGSFVAGSSVHLGIVVALRTGGLLAPVIRHAADKDLFTVMDEMRDLVTRARTGRLRASEIGDATITLTQLGEGEVDAVVPIIHPPQVAILGLGAIHDEPWAHDGMLAVRPVVHATLCGDHRAVDGRLGSLFLASFTRFLQEPTS